MIETGDESIPAQRKRRRWIVVGGCVLLLLIAASRLVPRTSVVARARLVKVGQSRDEVVQLMGRPQTTYFSGPTMAFGERYSDMTSVELTVRALIDHSLGFASLPHLDTYPVDIQYDVNRQVERIRIKDSGSDQYVEH